MPRPLRPDFAWRRLARRLARRYPGAALKPQALVSVSAQRLHVVERGHLRASYPVSTARLGLGADWHSFRTPPGAHRVASKIGAGAPLYARFAGRRPTGAVARPNPLPTIGADAVCTRALWLDGLEPGKNLGGRRDSRSRHIYIHGTPDEKRVGRPASHGCVRMTNRHVRVLFDELREGSLVHLQ